MITEKHNYASAPIVTYRCGRCPPWYGTKSMTDCHDFAPDDVHGDKYCAWYLCGECTLPRAEAT